MLQNEGVQTFLSEDPEVWAVVHAKWHAYVLTKYLSLQDVTLEPTTEDYYDGTYIISETVPAEELYTEIDSVPTTDTHEYSEKIIDRSYPDGSLHY